MATTETENELVELEKRYWQAMQELDVATAASLTDFPCIVTGAHGLGRVDQKAFEQMMQNPKYSIESAELSDIEVRMLNDDVGVVAYKVHEQVKVDGKSKTLDAIDASTWVRRNGKWVCALHSEAIMREGLH